MYKRLPYHKTLVKNCQLHRLVLHAFNPIDNESLYQVNHIDHNRTNNNLINLEWVTPKENCNKKSLKSSYYNSIPCYDELGNKFNSYREAARKYNLSPNTVKRDILGLTTKTELNRMTFHK